MYALKEKVTDRLSRFFADSPNSSSPSSSSASPSPLARPCSKGEKSLSSYFSYLIPSAGFGSRSNEHQHGLKPIQAHPAQHRNANFKALDESLDDYVKYSPTYDKKVTPINQEDYEELTSGRSISGSEGFEDATDQHSPQKPLPYLMDESAFISTDLYEFLLSSLPNIVKGCQWVLLYSTLKHGISLRTLIRKSADLSGPCLLIAGDRQGAVFGGLLECPLKPTTKRKYLGTNQTFVFTTIYGEPRLFRPTGANRYYYLCLNDLLAFGGGGNFALCLDGDLLSGTSGPCETFGSLCLAHNQEFDLKNVELWGFTHASHYLT
ncbi:oxidation resistance protein 1-like [Juglans microcarpa x Juglans regia]|uniref:oxidation resistance protein 1-like n=1 Tax=Juglans microcarpa x Juglans regia TaxID=2249226 RepID=UPI001B7DD18F|nr:oxidation resistance protein 1-like [Juglans microcarpa x Juglans regia]